jgi:Acyl-protein synthetase, LuxE
MDIGQGAKSARSVPLEIEQAINSMLSAPIFSMEPERRRSVLLALLRREIAYASERNPQLRNYVEHWPVKLCHASTIAELPYLPAGVFKANPPVVLVEHQEVKHTLRSSATSGQTPSCIALDLATARRISRSVVAIIRNFIGCARRPYLIIDVPENLKAQTNLTARGAAIQALRSFATETLCCLSPGEGKDSVLDLEKLLGFARKWRHADVLVYGFTFKIWTCLVEALQAREITLGLPNIHVLHSGGWKRLKEQRVTKEAFARSVSTVFGCSDDRVIDYYGMVENVGVVYPDCEFGNKHVPAFAEVIVRDPLTLAPVEAGQQGLIQVCSVLPTSFPGFLVLTEDMGEIVDYDGCPCGRRGTCFRFAGRVPKAETRGCGNVETADYRHRPVEAVYA